MPLQAAIVLPDANLPLALRTIVFSALGTAGQRCTTTRRLFLHSSIADSFLTSLVAAYKSTLSRIGDPMAEGTLIGPVHAADGVRRFEEALEQVEKDGGEVLVGGKRASVGGELEGGNWVEPTIVKVANGGRGFEMMQRETFAPSKFRLHLLSFSFCMDADMPRDSPLRLDVRDARGGHRAQQLGGAGTFLVPLYAGHGQLLQVDRT